MVKAATLPDLVQLGSLTPQSATFLDAAVKAGLNILVSGGTQAGNPTRFLSNPKGAAARARYPASVTAPDDLPDRIGAEYDEVFPRLKRLQDELLFMLESAAGAERIKTHSVTARVKDRDGFLEKIRRKAYSDPFVDMPDLVGGRIVCLFLSDLPRLRQLVSSTFEVLEEEDKVEGGPIDAFGYMSHHFVCQIKHEHTGPRYDDLKDIKFEIQCRTLLMDAWANVSHYLQYKGEASIPEELRKDFHALSGLFYVADKHFELFFGQSMVSRVHAEEVVAAGSSGTQPINLDTVLVLMRRLFPDREQEAASTSEFVEEVSQLAGKYANIAQLEQALRAGTESAARYERARPPTSRHDGPGNGRYTAVGFARQALALADAEYDRLKYHGRVQAWLRGHPR